MNYQLKFLTRTPVLFRKNILTGVLITMLFLFSQCNKQDLSDEISFADEHFLKALIDLGVDKNKDGRISEMEAEATRTIRIWPSTITKLQGIEYFINLDTLSIIMNPLSEPDISKNIKLKFLELIACGLTSLDLSENTELVYLDCSSRLAMKNFLTELDLVNNPELEYLACIKK